MTITDARAASLAARQERVLDTTVHTTDGDIATWRTRLARGDYKYRTARVYSDGKRAYGFITHADAAAGLTRGEGESDPNQGLRYAPWLQAPKVVYDFAVGLATVALTRGTVELHPGSE